MKKCLILCLISLFLFSMVAETRAFVLKDILGEPEGVLVVYVDDKVEIDDPSKIKICFLNNAQKYEGLSVEELFEEALPPMTGKRLLIAAIFNIKSSQWMFIYTKWLGHRIRQKQRKHIKCPYCGKTIYLH